MNKEELYQQIEAFNNTLTDSTDKSSKTYQEARFYVNNNEAIDKASFIGYLIKNNHLQNSYNTILDMTFGSGNLISHIVFDNNIVYEIIYLNDRNIDRTNQNINTYIDNCKILSYDILEKNISSEINANLVILNPQIGGNYIEGDLYQQRQEKEKNQDILDKLTLNINTYLESGATILFYGEDKDFKALFGEYNYIRYKSESKQLYIVKKDFEDIKCFQKIDDSFAKIDCNASAIIEDNEALDFDDLILEIDNIEYKDTQKKLSFTEDKEIEKLKFSDEAKGKLNFPYKNILFKGVPGTGKSRAINEIIVKHLELAKNDRNTLRINIHSASSNSDLMQGIGISTNDNGNIRYSEKQGLILDIIKRATFNPNEPFVLILEEIQENSLNELIGDLIYLIEDNKRANLTADNQEYESYEELVDKLVYEDDTLNYVEIPYLVNDSTKYKKMIMPNNLFIFCTSNYRNDKKVIEDNLLRRFEVIEIYPKNQEQMGKNKKTGEYYFKNKDISNFLEKLNKSILKVMNDNNEIHPDRFIIGHAIWQNVNDEKSFYKSFLKLIVEFKDIREIEFEIFKSILKDLNTPYKLETYKNYYEMIKDIQSKINYEFIN
ncbi:AAA family ATPase [Aliarcobacter butzleri]|uniref:AAA family ATPase n=1 Tax=Aliarcobacter butzleri TaxID=28197 RepID=UPI001EDC4086|nr:AAA family ATPase [Aliarcobacter butzleri]MCG3667656.1 AAA family ATPase [Aliarcobacter butzleri]MDN5072803.1 AAA family ATPase [Aliarcobacter butzleri]MDN5121755.1 AAA family ATPase [Aliarcobacter butzleri]